jgi:hypothetical protein
VNRKPHEKTAAGLPSREAELFKVFPLIKHTDHAADCLSSRLVVTWTTHTWVGNLGSKLGCRLCNLPHHMFSANPGYVPNQNAL